MKYSLFFFASIFLSLFSCQQILDARYEEEIRENYTSPYMGKWVGTYSGQGSGNLIINVAKSGSISGTYGQDGEILISSVLDNGALLPVNSNDPNFFILYGSLNDKKGTWKKNNLQGNWTLTKQ